MNKIEIIINTNGSKKEKRKIKIPSNAISKFTGKGFETNSFEGIVTYKCYPRAIGPDEISIILQVLDNSIDILGEIAAIYEFMKVCKGCVFTLSLKLKNKDDEKFEAIEISKNEAETIKEIMKKLDNIKHK